MIHERTDFPYPVRVIESLSLPLPDGTILSAKAWLPTGAGPVPAVLEYLPYRKRDGTRVRDQGLHMYLAGHGYACIRLDIRGMGDSEGTLPDEYTPTEQQDGCDAIAWIAAQDWCDGQVAMIGISWGGFNGLQIAALQPPALKTVITVGSTDDRYATDVHYVGGCLSKDNVDWSATMMAQNDLPPDPEIVGPKWREMWLERIAATEPWAHIWMAHQRRDAYWQQGSICQDFSVVQVPVYAVSGWADNYSESVPRLLAGLTSPRLGLIGPWAHSFPHDVTVGPAIGWLQEVLRWLDHWLKGRNTGIMAEPMLRVWMQDSVPPRTCYTQRSGRWVGEAEWPTPRIKPQVFYPGAVLGPMPQAGEATVCSPLWVGAAAGEVGRYGEDADWPVDQREDDAGSFVSLSQPLETAYEILGAPRLHLCLRSDQPQALVAVRLTEVAPNGESTRISLGLLNLTHRLSHEDPQPLTPGQWTEAEIELDDIAHSFAPGNRIGVAVSTSYWPIAWPSPVQATVTLDLAHCALTLPQRPPRPEDATLRPFDPPESAPQTPVVWHPTPPKSPRKVTRDLLSDRMTVDFPRWTFDCEMTDINQRVTSEGFARYEITGDDPLSATTACGYKVSLHRPDMVAGHASGTTMTCDATHFHLKTWLEVFENGQLLTRRDWQESFPRDNV
ncbi:MAG: CocE/NonD family hydrolase [Cypionkella sp.]